MEHGRLTYRYLCYHVNIVKYKCIYDIEFVVFANFY